MNLMVRTISPRQSGPTADKRSLQTIGLLFAVATLIVIGAAGFTVRYQLGISADVIERAGVPQHSAT